MTESSGQILNLCLTASSIFNEFSGAPSFALKKRIEAESLTAILEPSLVKHGFVPPSVGLPEFFERQAWLTVNRVFPD